MTLYRLFPVVLVAGTLALIGCGDSSGGGGDDPGDVCNVGTCVDSSDFRDICEQTYEFCLEEFPEQPPSACVPGATVICGVTPAF